MNGRVYDPVIGRFLSRDPLVDGRVSQGANGYAYVWNNPLTLTDPSGYVAVNVTNRYLGAHSTTINLRLGAAGSAASVVEGRVVSLDTWTYSRLPDLLGMQQFDHVRNQLTPTTDTDGERRAIDDGGDQGPATDGPQGQPPEESKDPCDSRFSAQTGATLSLAAALAKAGVDASGAAQFTSRSAAFNRGADVLGRVTQGRLAAGTLAHSINWWRLSRGVTLVAVPVASYEFYHGFRQGGLDRVYATADATAGVAAVFFFGPIGGAMVAGAYSAMGGTEGVANLITSGDGRCAAR
jgi:hypothetical protein